MWPQARAARGGHDQIKARIDLLVAQTNTVYETSGADQRINLVAAEEVEGYTEVVQPSWSSLPGGVAPTVTDLDPNQIHPDPGGDPMGVALTADNAGVTGVDGPADAVRALNSTRTIVAERRQGRAVTVAFKGGPYSPAVEGGSASTVTVRLNAAPGRELVIPLTATGTSGAWAGDYGVTPLSVVFGAEETERTVTVTAVDDAAQEDAETLILAFDETLPAGVTAASPDSATVTLTDNDTVTVAPSIGTVTISSDPGVGGVYTVGEEIEVTVVFNKPVTVTGRPQLEVTVGTAPEQAVNQSGRSASEVLVFAYAVVAGDSDADGVSIAADSLTLNGGTITDSTNRDAALGHSAVGDTGDPVDGITPELQTATVDAAVMTLTYDAALDEMSTPATSAFTVTVDGAAQSVLSVQVAESVVTLELDTRVVFEQVVRLSYTPGAQPVRGGNGNPVASLSSRLVTNQSPEPVYDADADGLIGITTLAQLDAIRRDVDGDGVPTTTGAATYRAAFPLGFRNAERRLRLGPPRDIGRIQCVQCDLRGERIRHPPPVRRSIHDRRCRALRRHALVRRPASCASGGSRRDGRRQRGWARRAEPGPHRAQFRDRSCHVGGSRQCRGPGRSE